MKSPSKRRGGSQKQNSGVSFDKVFPLVLASGDMADVVANNRKLANGLIRRARANGRMYCAILSPLMDDPYAKALFEDLCKIRGPEGSLVVPFIVMPRSDTSAIVLRAAASKTSEHNFEGVTNRLIDHLEVDLKLRVGVVKKNFSGTMSAEQVVNRMTSRSCFTLGYKAPSKVKQFLITNLPFDSPISYLGKEEDLWWLAENIGKAVSIARDHLPLGSASALLILPIWVFLNQRMLFGAMMLLLGLGFSVFAIARRKTRFRCRFVGDLVAHDRCPLLALSCKENDRVASYLVKKYWRWLGEDRDLSKYFIAGVPRVRITGLKNVVRSGTYEGRLGLMLAVWTARHSSRDWYFPIDKPCDEPIKDEGEPPFCAKIETGSEAAKAILRYCNEWRWDFRQVDCADGPGECCSLLPIRNTFYLVVLEPNATFESIEDVPGYKHLCDARERSQTSFGAAPKMRISVVVATDSSFLFQGNVNRDYATPIGLNIDSGVLWVLLDEFGRLLKVQINVNEKYIDVAKALVDEFDNSVQNQWRIGHGGDEAVCYSIHYNETEVRNDLAQRLVLRKRPY